jgi:hypothetical protein
MLAPLVTVVAPSFSVAPAGSVMLVIVTAVKLFAVPCGGPSFGSVKPKSPALKMSGVFNGVDGALSVPAGASSTESTVMFTMSCVAGAVPSSLLTVNVSEPWKFASPW